MTRFGSFKKYMQSTYPNIAYSMFEHVNIIDSLKFHWDVSESLYFQIAILECLDQLGHVKVFLYVNIQKWKNLINVPTHAFGALSVIFLRENNLNQFTWPTMSKGFLIVLFTLVGTCHIMFTL